MSSIFFRKELSPGVVIVLLLLTTICLLPSCEKDEGQGGSGSISGTIVEQFYNDDYSALIYQKPAVDEDVFVLYGDENTLGDRTITGVTGEFRFDFLYPGHYNIYFLTRDSTTVLDENQVRMFEVNLERGEKVDLGTLEKLSTLDYNDGSAVIKGVVKVINYVNESSWPNLIVEYIDFAHEHEVYLTYGNHSFYDKRVRTQYNGYFEYDNLIPGDYLIFLYSEDVTKRTKHVVLKYEVTITEFDQVVDLGEITIEKL